MATEMVLRKRKQPPETHNSNNSTRSSVRSAKRHAVAPPPTPPRQLPLLPVEILEFICEELHFDDPKSVRNPFPPSAVFALNVC